MYISYEYPNCLWQIKYTSWAHMGAMRAYTDKLSQLTESSPEALKLFVCNYFVRFGGPSSSLSDDLATKKR